MAWLGLSNNQINMERIEFTKDFSRDTTLFMQGLWAKGLTVLIKEKIGWDNPYLPFIAHYVNDGVVEIWQHKKAFQWFLDKLFEENKKGLGFLKNILNEYKDYLDELKKIHQKEYLNSLAEIKAYTELVYNAALWGTLFFYVGTDERNSDEAKAMAVESRKMGDFFADNDVFVRKNIAKLGGFTLEQAGVVLPNELEKLPSKEILDKRLQSFLLVDGVKSYLGTLDDFTKENPEYIFEGLAHIKNVSEFKGQVAFAGLVRGTVRIVKKQSHMQEVEEGDILVAPMTTPDFLLAMKKAAAFVTDEGGITCHAAIVAREMKKPCIIGTKIATQILKNGDFVEVDAGKGVVRIIK